MNQQPLELIIIDFSGGEVKLVQLEPAELLRPSLICWSCLNEQQVVLTIFNLPSSLLPVLAASLLSSLQPGELGWGAVFVRSDLYTPRQGSDKHLLTERNANRPERRYRAAEGGRMGGWGGGGRRRPPSSSCKLLTSRSIQCSGKRPLLQRPETWWLYELQTAAASHKVIWADQSSACSKITNWKRHQISLQQHLLSAFRTLDDSFPGLSGHLSPPTVLWNVCKKWEWNTVLLSEVDDRLSGLIAKLTKCENIWSIFYYLNWSSVWSASRPQVDVTCLLRDWRSMSYRLSRSSNLRPRTSEASGCLQTDVKSWRKSNPLANKAPLEPPTPDVLFTPPPTLVCSASVTELVNPDSTGWTRRRQIPPTRNTRISKE